MTIQELEQCIALYGNDIYSFCRHLTNDRESADDLYQDTFLSSGIDISYTADKLNISMSEAPEHYFDYESAARVLQRHFPGFMELRLNLPENNLGSSYFFIPL